MSDHDSISNSARPSGKTHEITFVAAGSTDVRAGFEIRNKAKKNKGPHFKSVQKRESSHKTDALVVVTRTIDRMTNEYHETVVNSQTGQVMHKCDEPLNKHTGHGSAKTLPATKAIGPCGLNTS